MDLSVLMGLVTTGAGVLLGKPRKGGAGDAWQTAAETYGLLHKPSGFWSGPKLSGSLSGNDLTVDMKNRNSASAATRFRLAIPPLGPGIRIRRRGFWNSLKPRIRVGDKAFDDQVVVDAHNEFAAREFLTPERRTAIRSFLNSFKGAVVTDDEISFTRRGYVKKPDEMIGAIDAMMHVASVLSEESHSAAVGPTNTVEAVAREPAPEVEAAPAEPEPELAVAAEPAPDDPPADERDNPAEPGIEATAPLDSLPSPAKSPGVEEFCAAVFAPGALSFTANQTFNEYYKGERIVWTGTLESMTPFTFDFDFGSGGGIKAVLTILESAAVGSRNVTAVIALPPGTGGLDDRFGRPVTFTGTLVKVDGLARKVLIADAALTGTETPPDPEQTAASGGAAHVLTAAHR